MTSEFPHPGLRRRLSQLWGLSRHYVHAKAGDPSYAGEWGSLKRYLDIVGIRSGQVVDVAAGDGVSQSCTLPLFRDPRWSGLAIEMDPVKFAKLAYVYAGYPSCQLAKCRVTPENICSLLQAHEIAVDFDLLNLDIDSYDLFVVKAMFFGGFRPKLVSMEVNEKVPPPLYFTVRYDPGHCWKGDHFFGCSSVAAAETASQFGYVLASIEYNNAMFVRSDLAQGRIQNMPVSKAYDEGYRNRPERTTLFPWNAAVDCALAMTERDALAFFSQLFAKYQGKFDLRLGTESSTQVRHGVSDDPMPRPPRPS